MSAEAAGLEPPPPADEGRRLTQTATADGEERRRRWRSAARGTLRAEVTAATEVAAPEAPTATVEPVEPAAEALDEPPFTTLWRRLPAPLTRWRAAALSATSALLLTVVLWRIFGDGLQGWVVGLGMDEERGALMGTLIVAAGAAGLVVAVRGHLRGARLGAIVGFVLVQVIPFLVRGSRTPTTDGLTAHVRLRGWILQPLGMLLLAAIVVSIGAALGILVRSDLASLVRGLRRRGRGAWLGVTIVAVLAGMATGPALTAVQDGPISALYDYSASPAGSAHAGGPALAAAGVPGGSAPSHARAASAETLPGRNRPGHITAFTVDGRSSLVYLPGDYEAEPQRSFPVLYFLHGYPGNPDQWVGEGAQLPQVLDQLIASGELPPVIAVMPNGNGQALSDAEWGDSQKGDKVEDWLVGRAVPEVDRLYRTLGTHFRGVAGLSAGGFGAVNLALRHPDVFRWAASYSGYFMARKDIFGPLAPENSPALVATKVPSVSRMPLWVGAGETDKVYLAQQAKFVSDLRGLGWLPLREELVPGGHGWEAWRLELVGSLRWLGGLWGSDPGIPQCRGVC